MMRVDYELMRSKGTISEGLGNLKFCRGNFHSWPNMYIILFNKVNRYNNVFLRPNGFKYTTYLLAIALLLVNFLRFGIQ